MLSHSNKKSCRGTLLRFTTSWYRKVPCTLGCKTQISVEFFWLTVLRVFVGKPFSVSLLSDISIIFIHRRGKSQYFVEFFLSHTSETKIRRTHWCSRNFWASKKFLQEKWYIMFFCRENFVSQCQKIIKTSRGSLLCFTTSGYRRFLCTGGV